MDTGQESAVAVLEFDQNDAEVRALTDQVVNHYKKLREAGMNETPAVILTRDFQRMMLNPDTVEALPVDPD